MNNKAQQTNKSSWDKLLTAETVTELRQIGLRISDARRRRGMSTSELATRMGVDRRTLSQLEKGSPKVSLGVFFQALSVLSLLRGIEEVVCPENDVETISANLRRIRKRLGPLKPIDDKKVDF